MNRFQGERREKGQVLIGTKGQRRDLMERGGGGKKEGNCVRQESVFQLERKISSSVREKRKKRRSRPLYPERERSRRFYTITPWERKKKAFMRPLKREGRVKTRRKGERGFLRGGRTSRIIPKRHKRRKKIKIRRSKKRSLTARSLLEEPHNGSRIHGANRGKEYGTCLWALK